MAQVVFRTSSQKIKLIFEFVSVFRLVFSCFTAPGPRKTQKKKTHTHTHKKKHVPFFLRWCPKSMKNKPLKKIVFKIGHGIACVSRVSFAMGPPIVQDGCFDRFLEKAKVERHFSTENTRTKSARHAESATGLTSCYGSTAAVDHRLHLWLHVFLSNACNENKSTHWPSNMCSTQLSAGVFPSSGNHI